MDKRYDVLVVGELNIDVILNQIERFPEIGKEVTADQMTLTLGSSSAIFASNLSALGSSVAFAGLIGQDHFGAQIISLLEQKNVHTGYISTIREFQTGATVVLNFGQECANITYPGTMQHFNARKIPYEAFVLSRHLHISSVFMQAGIKKDLLWLLKKAKSFGMSTSLDPQWDPLEKWDLNLAEILKYTDLFLPNAAELMAMTQSDSIEKGLDSLGETACMVIVKNGEDGARLRNGSASIHQAAFLNGEVADCVGAGDSFNAGFIKHFLMGKSLEKCLEYGALTGAINTTKNGGTAAFENQEAINEVAKNRFNYSF